jgi:hypothetical protein
MGPWKVLQDQQYIVPMFLEGAVQCATPLPQVIIIPGRFSVPQSWCQKVSMLEHVIDCWPTAARHVPGRLCDIQRAVPIGSLGPEGECHEQSPCGDHRAGVFQDFEAGVWD